LTVGGPLAVQAERIHVGGRLQASAIALSATAWVTVEAAGALTADRIEVTADVFTNTGRLQADGVRGGQVLVGARNVLDAGRIAADGPAGGGTVRLTFTDSYVGTAQALTTADGSVAGFGGSVRIEGGATGHLFSSGRQQATG